MADVENCRILRMANKRTSQMIGSHLREDEQIRYSLFGFRDVGLWGAYAGSLIAGLRFRKLTWVCLTSQRVLVFRARGKDLLGPGLLLDESVEDVRASINKGWPQCRLDVWVGSGEPKAAKFNSMLQGVAQRIVGVLAGYTELECR